MGATIVFFSSLGALSLLLGFKIFELKRGIKPFSASRYTLDTSLRKKTDLILEYAKYLNWQTIKLLLLFIVSEVKDFVVYVVRKIEDTRLGLMVRGKDIPPNGNGNGSGSTFLNSLKDERKQP